MNKPKGKPLLVCDCDPKGWPLYVIRESTRQDDQQNYQKRWRPTPSYHWTTESVRYTGDKKKTVAGCCPNCNRIFQFYVDYYPGDLNEHDVQMLLRSKDGDVHITSPHIKIVDVAEESSVRRDIPSRLGPQRLNVKSKARERFVKALERGIRAGLTIEELPDWNPQVSEEQFLAWQREIDQKLSRRGHIG